MNDEFEFLPQHILNAKDVTQLDDSKFVSVMKDVCDITMKQIDIRIQNCSIMFDKFIQTCESSDGNLTNNQIL